MRCIGLDVGQEACEVAIAEDGRIGSAGRIKTSRAELELFAQSLGPEDRVALEAGSGTLATARILEPHVARVVASNTKKLRQISHAKAKTDTLDARALARLLAAGFLDEVWVPDGTSSRGPPSCSPASPHQTNASQPGWDQAPQISRQRSP